MRDTKDLNPNQKTGHINSLLSRKQLLIWGRDHRLDSGQIEGLKLMDEWPEKDLVQAQGWHEGPENRRVENAMLAPLCLVWRKA